MIMGGYNPTDTMCVPLPRLRQGERAVTGGEGAWGTLLRGGMQLESTSLQNTAQPPEASVCVLTTVV